MQITVAELDHLVTCALQAAGMDEKAGSVTRAIMLTEQEGERHHGLSKLREYIDTLRSGWVAGRPEPTMDSPRPGIVAVDAGNGFAQPVLDQLRDAVIEKTRTSGVALLAMRNSHHYADLWPDVLPYAEQGLIAFAFLNSRSRLAPHGGSAKLFGTNPMAFACPRAGGPPVVWDQASSVMSAMRLAAAARRGEAVPPGVGIDGYGRPTTDPGQILDGGALLPFGGHKGSMIALTVEIMAAALTGGRFGIEDVSHRHPGARTSNAGLAMIVIEPAAVSSDFCDRVGILCSALASNGAARVPGEFLNARFPRPSDTMEVDSADYRYACEIARHPGGKS